MSDNMHNFLLSIFGLASGTALGDIFIHADYSHGIPAFVTGALGALILIMPHHFTVKQP